MYRKLICVIGLIFTVSLLCQAQVGKSKDTFDTTYVKDTTQRSYDTVAFYILQAGDCKIEIMAEFKDDKCFLIVYTMPASNANEKLIDLLLEKNAPLSEWNTGLIGMETKSLLTTTVPMGRTVKLTIFQKNKN